MALPVLPALLAAGLKGLSGWLAGSSDVGSRGRLLIIADALSPAPPFPSAPVQNCVNKSGELYYPAGANASAFASCDAVSIPRTSEGITPVAVVLCYVWMVLGFGVTGRYLRHGLEKAAFIASMRTTLQLALLGYLLTPIFKKNTFLLTFVYMTCAAFFAAQEGSGRSALAYPDMMKHCLIIMLTVGHATAFWALFIGVRYHDADKRAKFFDASHAIPIMGMILGNMSSAVAVTLNSLTNTLRDKRDMIEVKLSMGATRWEAMTSTIKDAVVLGMTPILNQMSIIGLVSIPGMMTGQILGGTSTIEAAMYQMLIMFLLSGASAIATTAMGVMVLLSCSDSAHRLQHTRLKKRGKKTSDPLMKLLQATGFDGFVAEQSKNAEAVLEAALAATRKALDKALRNAPPQLEEQRGLLMTTPTKSPAPASSATSQVRSPAPFPSLSAPSPSPASPRTPHSWGDWRRALDPASGTYYYYNESTQATTWSPPDGWPLS